MARRSLLHRTSRFVLAVSLPLLAQCDGNLDEGRCGGTAVAFTLPSPGDVLELKVLVCGDANESVVINIEVEMEGSQSRQASIAIGGGANVSIDQGALRRIWTLPPRRVKQASA